MHIHIHTHSHTHTHAPGYLDVHMERVAGLVRSMCVCRQEQYLMEVLCRVLCKRLSIVEHGPLSEFHNVREGHCSHGVGHDAQGGCDGGGVQGVDVRLKGRGAERERDRERERERERERVAS